MSCNLSVRVMRDSVHVDSDSVDSLVDTYVRVRMETDSSSILVFKMHLDWQTQKPSLPTPA